ncbi:MAG: homocysteine S-methyltransferase family protein [Chloroflexota bacterium]
MANFLERLNQADVLVADGATGTMLQKAGLPQGMPPERWNLENPDAVRALYGAYIDAGADIILTNTFGGSPVRLDRDGLRQQCAAINQAAARLARQVAGKETIVFGDIGPTGQLLEPAGALGYADAVNGFAEQAAALADGGVDALLIETMSDVNEARAAIEGAKKATALPVVVSFSFDTRGRTMMGLKPAAAVREAWSLGVAAVGANCGRTLTETLAAIQEMHQAMPQAVLMAKPNAGLPHAAGDDLVYDVTPEIMADYARQFAEEGVKIFGGCCGSTPEHIRAIAKTLKHAR